MGAICRPCRTVVKPGPLPSQARRAARPTGPESGGSGLVEACNRLRLSAASPTPTLRRTQGLKGVLDEFMRRYAGDASTAGRFAFSSKSRKDLIAIGDFIGAKQTRFALPRSSWSS